MTVSPDQRVDGSRFHGNRLGENRLEFHLMNWRRWMRHDSVVDGYPRQSCGFVGGGYSASFDDLVDSADLRCAKAVDAVVAGLPEQEKQAIHSEYLGARIRLAVGEFQLALARARRRVAQALFDRGFW